MSEVSVVVEGMTCGGCGQSLANVLKDRFDVVRIDHRTGTLVVKNFDTGRMDELCALVDEAGFQVAHGM